MGAVFQFDCSKAHNFRLFPANCLEPAVKEQGRETKYCELCGNLFIRVYEASKDSDGIARHTGTKICDACAAKPHEAPSEHEMLSKIAFIEQYQRERGRFPARGAATEDHLRVPRVRKLRYGLWREKISAAFKDAPKLTMLQLATALGETTNDMLRHGAHDYICATGEKVAVIQVTPRYTRRRLVNLYELRKDRV